MSSMPLGLSAFGLDPGDDSRIGLELRGRRDTKLEAELDRRVHPGRRDVVAVADPGDRPAGNGAPGLLERQDVGNDLTGMAAIGQAVDHGDCGIVRKLGQRGVQVRAHHERIGIAREHLRRIGNRLAAAELGVGVIETDRLPAELTHGDIEGDARACRRLLEDHDEDHVLDALRLERLRNALAGLLHLVRHVDDTAQHARVDAVEIEEVAGRLQANTGIHGGLAVRSSIQSRQRRRAMTKTRQPRTAG
jgi:hypothetical protein